MHVFSARAPDNVSCIVDTSHGVSPSLLFNSILNRLIFQVLGGLERGGLEHVSDGFVIGPGERNLIKLVPIFHFCCGVLIFGCLKITLLFVVFLGCFLGVPARGVGGGKYHGSLVCRATAQSCAKNSFPPFQAVKPNISQ